MLRDLNTRVDGEAVRRYQKRACLSIEELAHEAGVSVTAVQKMRKGSRHRPRTVRLVADALRVQPWLLLPKEDVEGP